MYTVSASDFPSPERGVFGTSIVDLTSKSALSSFTLLSSRERFKIRILFYFTSRKVIICYCFNYIFAEYMIFCTDTHCIHDPSNRFILNQISFKKISYFLISQINKSAQKSIKTILISYQKRAPNSQSITEVTQS